ncbi:hypothetical protein [Qiania dongpingensis]|uniref:Uncharacterized protein n=1 Tax=Qiania dongpingensis TaxID=2763669 RepID=A0A7G9G6Z2_9FIRM|nr:hypothetical protein [Qiania dongpingensis]QNM06574.1 hypothetical protein H9Q78_05430 [Qiania dongpingensis]
MKVRALRSFAGVVSMYAGEIKDVTDKIILKDLAAAGYIEPVAPKRGVKNESK